jgi:hypothetical protein
MILGEGFDFRLIHLILVEDGNLFFLNEIKMQLFFIL